MVRKFFIHGFATCLQQGVHSVLHVTMTMPLLVLEMLTGKMLLHRTAAEKWVANQLVQQYKPEVVYANAVLERVVAVMMFLAEHGSPFQGHNECSGFFS